MLPSFTALTPPTISWLPRRSGANESSPFVAQDRPSHQHLLQRRQAPLAAGQRGRRGQGGAEEERHVRHGGLVDHLGESATRGPPRTLVCSTHVWTWFNFFFNILQCLTGGSNGGVHCTDATNASRTMLFNIHTLQWDPELCRWSSAPSLLPLGNDSTTNCCCCFCLPGTLKFRLKSSPKSEAPRKYTAGWWDSFLWNGLRTLTFFRRSSRDAV